MAENSKIEWTDHTFNPWIGCQNVSPGCDNCYAEDMMADRYGRVVWGPHGSRSRTSAANWRKPLQWSRAEIGRRQRVFCASLADVFDNHRSITSGWHGDLWNLIASTPNLDWLLLTKRPQNIAKMLPETYGAPAWGDGWPNVWLGVTAENQAEADRRVPILLDVPAAVRFVSFEPALECVDFGRWLHDSDCHLPDEGICTCSEPREAHLDWIIAGAESGRGARPAKLGWFRATQSQCERAGVAFFMKQLSGAGGKPIKDIDRFPADLRVRQWPA